MESRQGHIRIFDLFFSKTSNKYLLLLFFQTFCQVHAPNYSIVDRNMLDIELKWINLDT